VGLLAPVLSREEGKQGGREAGEAWRAEREIGGRQRMEIGREGGGEGGR